MHVRTTLWERVGNYLPALVVVMAGLSAASPARAGSWQVVSGYPKPTPGATCQSTTTDSYGDPPSTSDLTTPELSIDMSMGTNFTMSYSEDWAFEWVPAYGMDATSDPPVPDREFLLINLSARAWTNGDASHSGFANASVSGGDLTESVNLTSNAGDAPQSPDPSADTAVVEFALDGSSPQVFTVPYSASFSTDVYGVGGIDIELSRNLGGKYIKITNATVTKPNMFTNTVTLSASGNWSSVTGGDQDLSHWKIEVYWWRNPTSQAVAMLGGPRTTVTTPQLTSAGTWSTGSITVTDPGGYGGLRILVILKHLNADGWGTYPGISANLFTDSLTATLIN